MPRRDVEEVEAAESAAQGGEADYLHAPPQVD